MLTGSRIQLSSFLRMQLHEVLAATRLLVRVVPNPTSALSWVALSVALSSSGLRYSGSFSGEDGVTWRTSTPRKSSLSTTKPTDLRYLPTTTPQARIQSHSRTVAQFHWQGALQAPTPPDRVSMDGANTPTLAWQDSHPPSTRPRVRRARAPDTRGSHMTTHLPHQ